MTKKKPKSGSSKDNANLQLEYGQVCQNFRLLTDIRFKLLALLPIGTGAGVGITLSKDNPDLLVIGFLGLFGLAITIALYMYNRRNNQFYCALGERARDLEKKMNFLEGAFKKPKEPQVLFSKFRVTHWFAISLIYGASMAAWLFLALIPVVMTALKATQVSTDPYLIAAAVALVIVVFGLGQIPRE